MAPRTPQESPREGDFDSPSLDPPPKRPKRGARGPLSLDSHPGDLAPPGGVSNRGGRSPPLWPKGIPKGALGLPPLASFLGGLGGYLFHARKDSPPGSRGLAPKYGPPGKPADPPRQKRTAPRGGPFLALLGTKPLTCPGARSAGAQRRPRRGWRRPGGRCCRRSCR